MKYLKNIVLLLPFMLVACGTSKKVAQVEVGTSQLSVEQLMATVESQALTDECLTAKMNFHFKSGSQDLSVGGHLKMKKNDVIQLSLVALGIMEAARIEFTPQEVLVIDRLNKRYIRAPYKDFSFLKDAGIDYSILESLFRNALFSPEGNSGFVLGEAAEGTASVECRNRHLKFRFLTSLATSLIQQTKITSAGSGAGEFSWNYSDFTAFNGKSFPLQHQIRLSGLGRDAEIDIQLKNIGNDSKWEAHTAVKSSYKEMQASDILKMLRF